MERGNSCTPHALSLLSHRGASSLWQKVGVYGRQCCFFFQPEICAEPITVFPP